MDRYRLIAAIVVCLIYLLAMFPMQTLVCGLILLFVYLIIRSLGGQNFDNSPAALRRRAALQEAKIYLAPYNDIWRNLRLSNTNCCLRLSSSGQYIKAYDSRNPGNSFKITGSTIHSMDDLWDMFCISFSYNTTYKELKDLCNTFQAQIDVREEAVIKSSVSSTPVKTAQNTEISKEVKEKLDVNNSSEMELTALPGVSIVLAKKIIKRREELGGFKDVNSFLEFTGLKPHMRLQLRDLVCVNKMKGSGKIKRYNERSIDL